MAKIAKVKVVLSDAVDVKAVWNAIPDFKMGGISLNDFIAVRDETDSLDKEYSTRDVELTGVKNKRDDKARLLDELITRFRSGMRSTYGPDSSQYEQAGGTRNSSRKSPTRKARAASAGNTDVVPQP
jgi:hypothetical protein